MSVATKTNQQRVVGSLPEKISTFVWVYSRLPPDHNSQCPHLQWSVDERGVVVLEQLAYEWRFPVTVWLSQAKSKDEFDEGVQKINSYDRDLLLIELKATISIPSQMEEFISTYPPFTIKFHRGVLSYTNGDSDSKLTTHAQIRPASIKNSPRSRREESEEWRPASLSADRLSFYSEVQCNQHLNAAQASLQRLSPGGSIHGTARLGIFCHGCGSGSVIPSHEDKGLRVAESAETKNKYGEEGTQTQTGSLPIPPASIQALFQRSRERVSEKSLLPAERTPPHILAVNRGQGSQETNQGDRHTAHTPNNRARTPQTAPNFPNQTVRNEEREAWQHDSELGSTTPVTERCENLELNIKVLESRVEQLELMNGILHSELDLLGPRLSALETGACRKPAVTKKLEEGPLLTFAD